MNDKILIIDSVKHFIHLETELYYIVSKLKQSKRKFTILKTELEIKTNKNV